MTNEALEKVKQLAEDSRKASEASAMFLKWYIANSHQLTLMANAFHHAGENFETGDADIDVGFFEVCACIRQGLSQLNEAKMILRGQNRPIQVPA